MPNVRENRWLIVTRLVAALSTAFLPLAIAGCTSHAESQRQPPPPTVTVTEVVRKTVPIVVKSNGTTKSPQSVSISARVKGFLKEQHFREGDNVKAGQLLFVIDEEEFRVKLAAARANLAEAEASLKKAEQSKSREISQAQVALDQAGLLLAQVEDRRERTLLARNATPKEEVDRKDAMLKKSEAEVQASQANLEQALADYQTNLLLAKANVEKSKAAVRDAEINLGYCRMSAPIHGRIGEAKVKVGNLVGANLTDELATIQQLNPMSVEVRPSARFLPDITPLVKRGLNLMLTIEGERQHPHPARVTFMDNQVDPTTSTVLLKAEVSNPDESLLPGEYVQTAAVVGEYRDALVVPERAVVEGQSGPTVYVVGAGNKVDVARVEVLDTYQGLRVLGSGVEAGQKVIVEGLQLVRPGQEVKTETARDLAPVRPGQEVGTDRSTVPPAGDPAVAPSTVTTPDSTRK